MANDEDGGYAVVKLTIEYDDAQLAAARERAAMLDAHNLGSGDAPDDYSPAHAYARLIATGDEFVAAFMPNYSVGYTAEPVEDS